MTIPLARGLLWTMCALAAIHWYRLDAWRTAFLDGLFSSVPQNISLIIANLLISVASVRMSHMIETASSTFVFGLILVWVLHPLRLWRFE